MKNSFLVVLALLCGNALCVKYQADIVITNDPNMPNAKINAKLYYQFEPGKHTAYFEYKNFGMNEFFNYTALKRLVYCDKCESATISTADRLDLESAEKKSDSENGCTKWTISGNSVKEIWAKDTREICKVIFNNGKTYTYSNYNTNPPATFLTENLNWKCPQPVCTKSVDIVLVIDDSGSISSSEWKIMTNFAGNVIDSFNPNTARFGLVTFEWGSTIVSRLNDNPNSVKNSLNTYRRKGGNTCIGCGITDGNDVLGDARPDATKIMIVFSDGYNNVGSYVSPASIAKSNNITIIAVGIDGASASQMTAIASEDANGKDLYINAKNFNDLKNKLDELVKETCRAAPDTYKSCSNCGGGFCGCNQKCVCPTCEGGDKCTSYTCSNPNIGCTISKTQCFVDICHNDACDPKKGCDNSLVDCSSKALRSCYDYGCDPSKGGCFGKPNSTKCRHKVCHTVQCTSEKGENGNGCVYTEVKCSKRNCQNERCENDKCVYEPRPCSNPDTKCRRYECNPITDKCDEKIIKHPERPCYNMTCYDDKGPVYTLYKCPEDPTAGECQQSYCDPETDTCKTIKITDCDRCKNMNCDGITDGCGEGRCEEKDGKVECVYVPTVSCNVGCAEGLVCNKVTGNCDKTDNYTDKCAEAVKDNHCVESTCDIETGQCKNETNACNDRLPCYVGVCRPGSTECEYESVCGKPKSPCTEMVCETLVDGMHKCVEIPRECEVDADMDFNPECEEMVCNNKTDRCEVVSNCDPCKGVVCDDGDLCTNKSCVVENGEARCEYTPKCAPNDDYCNPIVCNAFGNCVVEPRSCRHLDVSSKEESCYKVECVESARECRKVVIEDAFTDVCGRCLQAFGDDEAELKEKQEDTACIGALRAEEFAAALTGAAIAGIIIACVVVAAIIATAGYFGTKELIRRAKMAQDQSANNNPLYEGNANEMSNPSYAGAE